MPSRDSPRSVDPDDVEVAEVDTFFIHQGRAGAAFGAAGCTGRGLLSSSVHPCAELSTQDGCGKKEQVSGDVSLEGRGTLRHRWSLKPAFSKKHKGKGLFGFPSLIWLPLYPHCLTDLRRGYTSAEERTTWKGIYQPLWSILQGDAWKCCLSEMWVGFCMELSRTDSTTFSGLKLTDGPKSKTKLIVLPLPRFGATSPCRMTFCVGEYPPHHIVCIGQGVAHMIYTPRN